MIEIIQARIQGETDWIQEEYKVSELNQLKDPKINNALVGAAMGTLLNGDPIKELPIEKKVEVKKMLASYIANSNTFSKMLELNMSSIFITSLMVIDNNNKRGYGTRIQVL